MRAETFGICRSGDECDVVVSNDSGLERVRRRELGVPKERRKRLDGRIRVEKLVESGVGLDRGRQRKSRGVVGHEGEKKEERGLTFPVFPFYFLQLPAWLDSEQTKMK